MQSAASQATSAKTVTSPNQVLAHAARARATALQPLHAHLLYSHSVAARGARKALVRVRPLHDLGALFFAHKNDLLVVKSSVTFIVRALRRLISLLFYSSGNFHLSTRLFVFL